MVKFAKVSRFKDADIPLPSRATANSAGYDFVVAEDTIIPPYDFIKTKIQDKVFRMDYMKITMGSSNHLLLMKLLLILKS